MKFQTFGNPKNPVALLIHSIFYPGVTSYNTLIPLLEKKYYVIVPNLDGLSYPHTNFVSTRGQAAKILEWLRQNDINHIHFLLGSSYGTSVAFEILKEQWLSIDKAGLDAPALKQSKIRGFIFYLEMKKMINSFIKKGKDAFNTIPHYKYLSKTDEDYCLQVFRNMDKKSLKKLAYACYDYTLPSQLYRRDTKVRFLFGENDKAKMNLPEIRNLDSGEIIIIDGMSHMQFMFEKPNEFLKECGLEL